MFVCLFGFLPSSSITRLYRGRVPRLTFDNFTCCHTRVRAGRPWLLSPNQKGAAGHSRDRARDLLTRSRALYRLSYRAPRYNRSAIPKTNRKYKLWNRQFYQISNIIIWMVFFFSVLSICTSKKIPQKEHCNVFWHTVWSLYFLSWNN